MPDKSMDKLQDIRDFDLSQYRKLEGFDVPVRRCESEPVCWLSVS